MPKVARMVVSGSRPMSGRSAVAWSAMPMTATTMAAASRATQKLPVSASVVAPVKPPSMTRSPWAKLTTSMMPKISVRPEATRARIMPFTMPVHGLDDDLVERDAHRSDPQVLPDDVVVVAQLGGRRVVADLRPSP